MKLQKMTLSMTKKLFCAINVEQKHNTSLKKGHKKNQIKLNQFKNVNEFPKINKQKRTFSRKMVTKLKHLENRKIAHTK